MTIEMMFSIMVGVTLGFFFFTIMLTIIAGVCVAIVIGFKNSTHQVSYVNPYENDVNELEKENRDEDALYDMDFNPFGKVNSSSSPSKDDGLSKDARVEEDYLHPSVQLQMEKERKKFEKIAREALLGEDDE